MAPGVNNNDGIVLTSLLCRHFPWRSGFVRMKAQIAGLSRLGDIETLSTLLLRFLPASRSNDVARVYLSVAKLVVLFLLFSNDSCCF